MGFGAGSALTVVPIANMIKTERIRSHLPVLRARSGRVVFVLGWFLRTCPTLPSSRRRQRDPRSRDEYAPSKMLRTPVFWVIYAMFVLIAAGGLMATAQLAPIAHDFGLAELPVSSWA